MADTLVSPVVALSPTSLPAQAETVKKATAKIQKAKPSHPSTAGMVNAAIKTLSERNGSSLQAIKKYMAGTYKLNTEKHALFIKKYLKSAVTAGALVQTKGKGASGSFKLAVKKSEAATAKPKVKTSVKKEGSPKKALVKKPVAKDSAAAKLKKGAAPKTVAAKKLVAEKKLQPKASTSKSPKAKKASKLPTAKPKAPKPKKATAPKAKAVAKKPVAAKK